MAKTIPVTLDGNDFVVPALNIEQLQNVAEVIAAETRSSSGFAVLKIAMKRATPIPDWETLAPTLDEIGEAIAKILRMSGLQKPDANPQLTVVSGTKQSN